MDDTFRGLGGLESRDASRDHSQYPTLQSRFRPFAQSVSARDRYRAPHPRNEPIYDEVEDDQGDQELPLDSFGKFSSISIKPRYHSQS